MSDPISPSPPVALNQQLRRYPILIRLLIGNAIVVFTGAVIGTVITRQFTSLNLVELILLFSGLGILFSLGMNYWVIHTAQIPLRELRLAVDRFKAGDKFITEMGLMSADPDIHRLVLAINSMLERLEYRTRLLSALSERTITAQEEERKRIARSLHDDTAQSLSTLIIQLERMETNTSKSPIPIATQLVSLRSARELATQILEDLRKNIWDLRPSILDDLGLCPAIRWLAGMNLGEAGIKVDFNLPPENIRLPAHLETTLFRVIQEAVNNVIRHSNAQHVIISLIPGETRVCLEIEDDGRGFDAATIGEQAIARKRLGLLGIQERTTLVDGVLRIESQPGTGTRVHVCVPLLEKYSFDRNPDDHASIEMGQDKSLEMPLEKIS